MEHFSTTLHSKIPGLFAASFSHGNVVPLVMPPVDEDEDEDKEKDSK